jgi:AcrR family transcriptional regulator
VSRPGLTVEVIVAAAAAEVDANGFDALSLGAVAQRLKVKPPSLYNHLDGLEGLRRAVSIYALKVLGEAVGRAAMGKSQEEALVAMGMAVRELARTRPGLYAATVRAHPPRNTEAAAASQAVLAPFVAVLAGFGLTGTAAVHAMRAMRSAAHGFASLEAGGGFGMPASIEASYRFLLSAIVKAIRQEATGGEAASGDGRRAPS